MKSQPPAPLESKKNCCKPETRESCEIHSKNILNFINDGISKQELKKKTEQLKYKMGHYLLNSKDTKITFQWLVKRYWFKVISIFFAALIFNAGIQIFLQRAQTIPSGVTGIPTLIQYIVPAVKSYFALIYLACNIPLFLIFGWKIKKSFVFLTLTFMIFQIVSNLLFTLDAIGLESYLNKYITFTDSNPPFTNWSNIVYSIVGALFIALGISISWKSGGSTGGTDIIAYYYSVKSKKSVGNVLTIIGVATAIVFLIIFAIINPNYLYPYPIDNDKKIIEGIVKAPIYREIDIQNKDVLKIIQTWNYLTEKGINHKVYFGIRELTTFLYILVVNVFIDIIYPKYKKVNVTIVCSDPAKVLVYFKLIDYWHSYRIERYKSGYTGKFATKISTVMLILETPNIISDLKTLDPKIWISITKVHTVIGNFNTDFVEH
ncbi:putative 5xTM membrane YitT family protein [Mycoplasmopsis mustelae]|uniref:Putative 5xTM membrane YitT family protein n=1 Tax=Mycoplasmopsis mustelae TaxID=171289 RepID=A0A4V3FNU8_9BACT|nr:YitT family protein [Mycoplasmopsis mustelae]TDV23249.1 putative 5xTM membrane YitT family protein [Mycoplasmopsis mustelae]